MEMLRLGHSQTKGSDNESITSLEYHKPNNSTIGKLIMCKNSYCFNHLYSMKSSVQTF